MLPHAQPVPRSTPAWFSWSMSQALSMVLSTELT